MGRLRIAKSLRTLGHGSRDYPSAQADQHNVPTSACGSDLPVLYPKVQHPQLANEKKKYSTSPLLRHYWIKLLNTLYTRHN